MSEPKVDDAPKTAAEGEPKTGDQGAQVESGAQAKDQGSEKATQKKDEPTAQQRPAQDAKKEEPRKEEKRDEAKAAPKEEQAPPPVQEPAQESQAPPGSAQGVLMQALANAQRALVKEATAQPVLMVLQSAREEASEGEDLSSGTRKRLSMTLEAARRNPALPQEAQTALAAVAVALRGI